MTCPPKIADVLIKIDGYAEKKDPTIFETLDQVFVDPEMIVDVLRYWPEKYHYAAILYLRKRGWGAGALDDKATSTEYYWYTTPGSDQMIDVIPLHKRDMAHLNRMINVWMNNDKN
jgi:hypothetical protein